jgi:hypothetical protein
MKKISVILILLLVFLLMPVAQARMDRGHPWEELVRAVVAGFNLPQLVPDESIYGKKCDWYIEDGDWVWKCIPLDGWLADEGQEQGNQGER